MHWKGIGKIITDQKTSLHREMFPFPSAYRERQAIQRFCIVEHQKCIESLDFFEVAGPRLRLWPVPFFAGNFWWANSSYIRTLQPPLSEARFSAKIDWSSVSRQTAQRIAQLRNKLPVYEHWGRSANEFWICNNTVHPDGSISMRFPDMDCSIIRSNFSQLYAAL